MNVGQLKHILAAFPDDVVVVVDGYEEGVQTVNFVYDVLVTPPYRDAADYEGDRRLARDIEWNTATSGTVRSLLQKGENPERAVYLTRESDERHQAYSAFANIKVSHPESQYKEGDEYTVEG